MATLLNVAERAGVSVTTISRMLNNRVNVSEKTRKKIYAAMKELNYYPNEIARSLTKKKSNIIGLIVPSAKNFFYSQIIEYTEYYAEKKGYKLLLCISNHDSEKESRYFGMLKANKVTGIIIASRFNVYTRTGTASLAVSVLGFVVTAPLWIYVSRLVS